MTTSSPDTVRAVSDAPDTTRSIARAFAELVQPSDVILLGGDLGAGKTTFTQGLGAALGVAEQIVSPTFTIERVYSGRVELHHLDAYRLESLHEAIDLGLGDALDDGGVVVVEWGEAIVGVVGMEYLVVRLEFGAGDDDRIISFTPVGQAWVPRMAALRAAVQPWATSSATATATPPPTDLDDGDA